MIGPNLQVTEFEDNSHAAETLEELSDVLSDAATELLEDNVTDTLTLVDEVISQLGSIKTYLAKAKDGEESDD